MTELLNHVGDDNGWVVAIFLSYALELQHTLLLVCLCSHVGRTDHLRRTRFMIAFDYKTLLAGIVMASGFAILIWMSHKEVSLEIVRKPPLMDAVAPRFCWPHYREVTRGSRAHPQ